MTEHILETLCHHTRPAGDAPPGPRALSLELLDALRVRYLSAEANGARRALADFLKARGLRPEIPEGNLWFLPVPPHAPKNIWCLDADRPGPVCPLLPGPSGAFFMERCSREGPLVLVACPLEAMELLHQGYDSVAALPPSATREDLDLVREALGDGLPVLLEAGNAGVSSLRRLLGEARIEHRGLRLREGLPRFLKQQGPEGLRAALKGVLARPAIPFEYLGLDHGFLTIGTLEVHLEKLREDRHGRGFRAMVDVAENGRVIYQSEIRLWDGRNLASFAVQAARRAEGGADPLEIEQALREVNIGLREFSLTDPAPVVEVMDPGLRREAMELLTATDLLDRMARDLDRLGVVGEERNKQILHLAMVSRMLPRPVSVLVKGPSSAGKSHLVRGVASLQPEGEVLTFTHMSPKVLYHAPQELFRHRVLFLDEYLGQRDLDASMRILQSEGRLEVAVTAASGGGFAMHRRTVTGPVCFVTTTTRPDIFDENETRAFTLMVDTSPEQTRRVHEATRSRYHPGAPPTEAAGRILERWRAASAMLEPLRVLIPYVHCIEFGRHGRPRDRRDMARLLSLLEASALLHQHQRDRVQHGRESCVEASLEDYAVAWRLAPAFLTPGDTPGKRFEEFLATCAGLPDEYFSHRDVMARMQISRPTAIRYCSTAESLGCLQLVSGGNGREKHYRYVCSPEEARATLLHPDEVTRRWEATRSHKTSPTIDDPSPR